MEPSEYIDYRQLSLMLKRSEKTLKNWASMGKLPKTHIRGLFSRKAIEEWMKLGHVPSALELMHNSLQPKKK